jgi:hypothetical protein
VRCFTEGSPETTPLTATRQLASRCSILRR